MRFPARPWRDSWTSDSRLAAKHVRLSGVQNDLPQHGGEVRLLLDQKRLEAAAEEVSRSLVPPIEPDDISGVQPLHSAGWVGLRRLNEQVKVIGRENVCGEAPTESDDGSTEELKEHLAIAIADKDRSISVARSYVMGGAGEVGTKCSCH